jgi:hypothetical protein
MTSIVRPTGCRYCPTCAVCHRPYHEVISEVLRYGRQRALFPTEVAEIIGQCRCKYDVLAWGLRDFLVARKLRPTDDNLAHAVIATQRQVFIEKHGRYKLDEPPPPRQQLETVEYVKAVTRIACARKWYGGQDYDDVSAYLGLPPKRVFSWIQHAGTEIAQMWMAEWTNWLLE